VAEKGIDAGVTVVDREIVLTRVFDAPRSLVWDAWTDPKAEHLAGFLSARTNGGAR
jgi:uncharacterized protein YndB with AHSA1/START domain